MKLMSSILLTLLARADFQTTSFDIQYENFGTVSYRECGQCIGYSTSKVNSASIVLYEKDNQAYWVLNISKDENNKVDVDFYFVDRNPNLPESLRGTYYPRQDVSAYFESKELEFKPGGHIVGKLHPVQLQNIEGHRNATFSGSFDIHLKN